MVYTTGRWLPVPDARILAKRRAGWHAGMRPASCPRSGFRGSPVVPVRSVFVSFPGGGRGFGDKREGFVFPVFAWFWVSVPEPIPIWFDVLGSLFYTLGSVFGLVVRPFSGWGRGFGAKRGGRAFPVFAWFLSGEVRMAEVVDGLTWTRLKPDLRMYREMFGMSTAEFGRLAAVDGRTVRAWENPREWVPDRTAWMAAESLWRGCGAHGVRTGSGGGRGSRGPAVWLRRVDARVRRVEDRGGTPVRGGTAVGRVVPAAGWTGLREGAVPSDDGHAPPGRREGFGPVRRDQADGVRVEASAHARFGPVARRVRCGRRAVVGDGGARVGAGGHDVGRGGPRRGRRTTADGAAVDVLPSAFGSRRGMGRTTADGAARTVRCGWRRCCCTTWGWSRASCTRRRIRWPCSDRRGFRGAGG